MLLYNDKLVRVQNIEVFFLELNSQVYLTDF